MESCSPEKNMLCSDRKNNYTKEEHIDTCCTETKYMTLYQKKLQSILAFIIMSVRHNNIITPSTCYTIACDIIKSLPNCVLLGKCNCSKKEIVITRSFRPGTITHGLDLIVKTCKVIQVLDIDKIKNNLCMISLNQSSVCEIWIKLFQSPIYDSTININSVIKFKLKVLLVELEMFRIDNGYSTTS